MEIGNPLYQVYVTATGWDYRLCRDISDEEAEALAEGFDMIEQIYHFEKYGWEVAVNDNGDGTYTMIESVDDEVMDTEVFSNIGKALMIAKLLAASIVGIDTR